MKMSHVLLILMCINILPCFSTLHDVSLLIARRMYYITRLSPTIELLAHLDRLLDALKHVERGEIVPARISSTTSFVPVLEVWKAFTSYRYIEDEQFDRQFLQQLFIITYKTYVSLIEHMHNDDLYHVQREKNICVNELEYVREIEQLTHVIMHQFYNQHMRPYQLNDVLTESFDPELFSTRLYCIQRIRRSVALITRASCAHPSLYHTLTYGDVYHQYSTLLPSCPKDFFSCWTQFRHAQYVHHDMRIFLVYLIGALAHVINYFAPNTGYAYSLEELSQIAHNINQMPIDEILDLIDQYHHTATEIVDQHAETENNDSTFAYIQHAWPPLVMMFAATIITYFMYKPRESKNDTLSDASDIIF